MVGKKFVEFRRSGSGEESSDSKTNLGKSLLARLKKFKERGEVKSEWSA